MGAREKRRRAKYAALPSHHVGTRPASSAGSKRAGEDGQAAVASIRFASWEFLAAAAIVLATFVWMFWPTLVELAKIWEQEPDYSHGFIVPPIALLLLWLRKERFPKSPRAPGWLGLSLLAGSLLVAAVGQRFFLAPLAGWAMVIWVAGACWLLGGWRVFLWASPAILFLLFMVPLPFRIEQLMSWRLQWIATIASTWMLQAAGQPAIAEGNVVFLREHTLEVAQACSGLRMFMGIAALAFAFAVATRRPWWERLLILASVAPLAMFANSVRVAATGILFQFVSGDVAEKFAHDAAGWATIGFAAACLGLFLLWLRWIVLEVEVNTGRELISQSKAVS
jgi:exosortase